MDKNVERRQRVFSPMARWTLGVFSFLFGLMLLMWASGMETDIRYLPAILCFAIFGACVFPRSIAVWCGRLIAIAVLLGSAWYLYVGITDPDKSLIISLGLFGIYSVPALFFLFYSKLPFSFMKHSQIRSESNSSKSNEELQDAASMYDAGNLEAAFLKYKQLAEKGNESCQSFVGWLYMYGRGVERDYMAAVRWLKGPAESGDLKSQYDLGVAYVLLGKVDDGLHWLNKAASQNYPPAFARLGSLFDTGKYVEQNAEKALDYYRSAYRLGHILGRREYSVRLMNGSEGLTGRLRGLWLYLTKLFVVISIVREDPFSEKIYI